MCWDNSKRVLFSKNPIHCLTVNVHLELPLRIEFALSSVLCAICWHLSFQSELNKNKSRLYLKEKESLDDNQVSCPVHRHQSASATHQLISDWFQIKTISQPKKQIILQKTDWSNAAVLHASSSLDKALWPDMEAREWVSTKFGQYRWWLCDGDHDGLPTFQLFVSCSCVRCVACTCPLGIPSSYNFTLQDVASCCYGVLVNQNPNITFSCSLLLATLPTHLRVCICVWSLPRSRRMCPQLSAPPSYSIWTILHHIIT